MNLDMAPDKRTIEPVGAADRAYAEEQPDRRGRCRDGGVAAAQPMVLGAGRALPKRGCHPGRKVPTQGSASHPGLRSDAACAASRLSVNSITPSPQPARSERPWNRDTGANGNRAHGRESDRAFVQLPGGRR